MPDQGPPTATLARPARVRTAPAEAVVAADADDVAEMEAGNVDGGVTPVARWLTEAGHLGRRALDALAGPDQRVRDNLTQLACVLVGTLVGLVGGWLAALRSDEWAFRMLVGAIVGMVVSLLASGVTIGVIRSREVRGR